MASITQRFLVPVSSVSAGNTWQNDLPFVSQKKQPKIPFLISRIDYNPSVIWISPKNSTCLSGKLRTKITSPIAKSTSPGLSDMTFLAHCASWNPYPISDQNLWFCLPYFRPDQTLIPYFRPEALEPGAWPERVTSCYGTYTVVGVNIKREMVLSPNDEEVANSSKKHTQFKTRVHKPYPISDQNGRNWYPISDQNS